MTGMRGKREHLVYWFILLLFILAAAESLGLPRVTETLGVLVAYVPNILAAVLILLLGSILAHIIGDAVRALAVGSGLSGGQVLGQVTRYTILGITIILALEQLKIQTTLLIALAIILVAAIALALGLAFGPGNRELARNIMSGFHICVYGQHPGSGTGLVAHRCADGTGRLRIMVIGAGRVGARVLRQLQKNPDLTVFSERSP